MSKKNERMTNKKNVARSKSSNGKGEDGENSTKGKWGGKYNRPSKKVALQISDTDSLLCLVMHSIVRSEIDRSLQSIEEITERRCAIEKKQRLEVRVAKQPKGLQNANSSLVLFPYCYADYDLYR